MMRPCLTCGEPSLESYCAEHQPAAWQHRVGSARERGYDNAWQRLSKRARQLQPFCSDAHLSPCSGPLTCDHLPSAWERKAAGKPLRLKDVDVLCAGHNEARGSSRPGSARAQTQGTGPVERSKRPRQKPQSPILTQVGRQ